MSQLEQIQQEGEFIESWHDVVRHYAEHFSDLSRRVSDNPDYLKDNSHLLRLGFILDARLKPILDAFFAEVFSREFNRMLRAGTSFHTLIVSRSKEHGLRDDQPSIALSFDKNGITGRHNLNGTDTDLTSPLQLKDEIGLLFSCLSKRPID